MVRSLVRRDPDGTEYVRYDGEEFAIRWGVDKTSCPAPGYPVLTQRTPEYLRDRRRLMLFRFRNEGEYLGHADRRTNNRTEGS